MIAVDFDNTVSDALPLLWEHRRLWDDGDEEHAEFPRVINTVWDFDRYLPIGVSGRMWDYFHSSREFTRQIPAIPGANAGLRALVKHGASLMLVSDRPRHQLDWLLEWLDRNDFPPMMVVTTGCDNGRTKQEIAARYRIGVAIDDAPHHIRDYQAMGVHVLVKRYPYNKREQLLTPTFNAWAELTDDRLARIAKVSHERLGDGWDYTERYA